MALHVLVVVSLLVGLPVTWRALRRDRPAPSAGPRRWYHGPGWWLVAVIAAILVNQVLFTVYALRAGRAEIAELSRQVPSGWFAVADNRFMAALAAHVPDPGLLSVSALRIPSLLELPFGLLVYLTVLSWLDPRRYRQLCAPRVLAATALAYTATFSLIEWDLHTRYTEEDLILRAISCVLCAVALPRLGRRDVASPGHRDAVAPGHRDAGAAHGGAPRTAAELLAFVASAAALGYLVLALYDTALLYSLGRVGAHLPSAAVACGVLVGARWVAAAAAVLVTAFAGVAALSEVARRLPAERYSSARRAWLLQLMAVAVATTVAAAVGLLLPAAYPEARLLRTAVLVVVVSTLVCAGSDRWLRRRRVSTEA